MFPTTYRKTSSIIGMSLVLGIGAMAVLQPDASATGFAVAAETSVAFPLPVFLFGLFVGAVAGGLVFGILHHERKRL